MATELELDLLDLLAGVSSPGSRIDLDDLQQALVNCEAPEAVDLLDHLHRLEADGLVRFGVHVVDDEGGPQVADRDYVVVTDDGWLVLEPQSSA